MVIESKDASGTTPTTAGRSMRVESNSVKSIVTHEDARVDRAIHFDDFEASDQDSEEYGHADDNDTDVFIHEAEERLLHVSFFKNPRKVDRRQADERDEEDDGYQGVTPGEQPPLAPKATMNAETPVANWDRCRLAEEMKKSGWIQLFNPKAVS